MNEERLLDELNELAECVLCPMDLMESIDIYSNQKVIEELQLIIDGLDENGSLDIIKRRIKELKEQYT